jgi:hypothetical protein
MKKRGSTIMIYAFEIVLGAILLTFFIGQGTAWGKGEIIKQTNIAKDLGLTIGMLESSTVDTLINYRRDVSSYVIKLEKDQISILEDNQDTSPIRYSFPPTNQVNPAILVNPPQLYIIKNKEGISISEEKPPKSSKSYCPPLEGQLTVPSKVFLDPSLENLDKQEKQQLIALTSSLLNRIRQSLNSETSLLNPTNIQDDQKLSQEKIKQKEEEAGLVIKLTLSDTENKKFLFARVNPSLEKDTLEHLNHISCSLTNNILENNKIEFDSVTTSLTNQDFNNPKTIVIDISASLFIEEGKFSLASSLGNDIAGGIVDAFSD